MQQTVTPRPGRPKDPRVQARDEEIYRLISEGVASRSELAAASGHDRDAVYLSCKRLEKQDRIRKCLGAQGAAVWAVADGTPCS